MPREGLAGHVMAEGKNAIFPLLYTDVSQTRPATTKPTFFNTGQKKKKKKLEYLPYLSLA